MAARCVLAAAALLLGAARPAAGDIKFSRTVSRIRPDVSFSFTVGGGACAGSDEYGSDDCDIKVGTSYDATLRFTIPPTPLDAAARFSFSAKVTYRMVPLNFDIACPVCGDICNFTIPIGIAKLPVSFQLPDCPFSIPGGKYDNTTTIDIPVGGIVCPISMCPAAIPKFSAKGDLSVSDGTSALISVSFTASSTAAIPIAPKPCPPPCRHYECPPPGGAPPVCFPTSGPGPSQEECQQTCGKPNAMPQV